MHTDVAVIGGGIVGLATARALLWSGTTDSVQLLEKEPVLSAHQSTHNSGVLHAGLQYAPGSEKARLARTGIRAMTEYCRHHGIPHDICGKLVVATDESEVPRLDALLERGRANGLQGLRRLTPEEAREVEPHVGCVAAIQVPEEGIVDYQAVCEALAGEIRDAGGVLRTGEGVRELVSEGIPGGTGFRWRIGTNAGECSARVLVNCAGLHVDRVARLAGERPEMSVIAFRGEYQELRPQRRHLVRHLIYPVPEPGFPFLGVHFTRRIGGGVDAGPNAVLAFAREGYRLRSVNLRDLGEFLLFPGLRRFVVRHGGMVRRELLQSAFRSRLLAALRRLVPEIQPQDLAPAGSGVRAQGMRRDGTLIQDFLWLERPGAVHVLNAPSPAATASLSIGAVVAEKVGRMLVHSAPSGKGGGQ
ncbi:MAG: L-2-hydroxyglutarate oxidase [Gemmatimonadales bacterium]|jgi:L-2-hydroxyglutarate oxidase|nr:MAG: L-2-hydroxyglutarate oxidase [Gemmatimonadales bacterium]